MPDTVTLARPVVIAGYVAPVPVTGKPARPLLPIDLRFAGTHQITGTTKNTPATPVSRRVRLHDQRTGDPVREVWSDAAGVYSFTHIRAGLYYITGFDHTGLYGGVIETDVTPEPMP
jgi:hypothetical protein